MNLAIQTACLTRYFEKFCAVSGIDLAVERGTFYGFLGPNGAGKSTTIKMLTGLLAPSAGEIRVLGMDMRDARQALEAKSRIGVIPEDLALFDNLTAPEYLQAARGQGPRRGSRRPCRRPPLRPDPTRGGAGTAGRAAPRAQLASVLLRWPWEALLTSYLRPPNRG